MLSKGLRESYPKYSGRFVPLDAQSFALARTGPPLTLIARPVERFSTNRPVSVSGQQGTIAAADKRAETNLTFSSHSGLFSPLDISLDVQGRTVNMSH